ERLVPAVAGRERLTQAHEPVEGSLGLGDVAVATMTMLVVLLVVAVTALVVRTTTLVAGRVAR
ncbi:MAG TPA: hypothetical protein VFL84_06365, partial [Gammaproteobacteria bacterium]|nr:hypothetical protein [Gammaproteobacteria bacterium]